jgi:chorismate mutase
MSKETGKEPSREEVVVWYKEQIELSSLRADLAEQQARALRFESERLQHAVMIANIKTAGNEIINSEEDESPEETKS